MIFLDNAGTTKMFEECLKTYGYYACEKFYNPSAISRESAFVHGELEKVKKLILKKLGAYKGTIIFTGGATESNNLAIKGSVRNGDYTYIFTNGEHPSVYNVAKSLMNDGRKVELIKLDANGQADLKDLEEKLSPKVRLISCMLVSNETGAMNDIKKISALRDKLAPNALLHIDAVQGFMKIPFNVTELGIDLLSFSAHKFHGPKGVGGLYVKNLSSIKNIVEGGGQEYGIRSGTENVPGIMAMATAIEKIDIKKNFTRVKELCEKLNNILSKEEGIIIHNYNGSPYIESVTFKGVKGETMLHALEEKGVIVGLGSACSAKKAGNRVLKEIGFADEEIISSCRISFNAYMTGEEIETAGKIIVETYQEMKKRVS